MKELTGICLFIFVLVGGMVLIERINTAAAERDYARAAVIRAQSQANSDQLSLMYVYFITAVVALGGLVVLAGIIFLIYTWMVKHQSTVIMQQQPQMIMQREIYILPVANNVDLSNRQIYKQISAESMHRIDR